MKLISKLLLIVFSFIFLLSCTKDNTTNPQQSETMADYMPLTIGSWWKYDLYNIDGLGNRYNKTTGIFTITGTKIVDGKNAIVLTGQKENTDSIDEVVYYTIENEKLLLYYPHAQDIGWFVYADFKFDSIVLKDTTYITEYSGTTKENHDRMTLKKGAEKDFTIKNKIIHGIEFVSEGIYIIKYRKDGFDIIDSTISTAHNWFGKNVGYIYGESTLKYTGTNYPLPYIMIHDESVLIDYYVK
ncbi:MAG: hypothetical protein EPN82_07320 [Bacteroidetes bacterium]|nr:MAG: hypothetical protein EPN82_07320 [Bacteroidota bacterium]